MVSHEEVENCIEESKVVWRIFTEMGFEDKEEEIERSECEGVD